MSFCKSCGKEMTAETPFCASCGSPVSAGGGISVAGEGQMPAAAIAQAPTAVGSETMRTNLVGALAYLAGFITGIIFLALEPYKSNSFVRFHAYQSIFFNAAWIAFWIIWVIVSAILTPLTAGVFGVIALPIMLILSLAGLGTWALLMYQAYQQKLFKLPIVGKFAAQHAGVKL
jgi:uncharacterized membrane protein